MDLRYKIAALDIETLSLRTDCVIHEIGIVHAVRDRNAGLIVPVNEYTLSLSVMEQIARGRVADQETIDWQIKQFGIVELTRRTSGHMMVADARLNLQHLLHDCAEIWVNHPEFDLARIDTLFDCFGLPREPWNRQAVRDVSGLRKEMGLVVDKPKGPDFHTGVGDCKYTLAVVEAFDKMMASSLKRNSSLGKQLAL